MNPTTVALIVAIVAVLLGILTAFLGWRRRRSVRTLLRGSALALLSAGLWVTGVLSLLADAARGLWRWIGAQRLDTRMWIGLGIAAAAVIIFLISSAIDPVGRAEGRRRREARNNPTGAGPAAPQAPGIADSPNPAGSPAGTGSSGSAAPAAGMTPSGHGAALDSPDEDAEITAILRNHGIH